MVKEQEEQLRRSCARVIELEEKLASERASASRETFAEDMQSLRSLKNARIRDEVKRSARLQSELNTAKESLKEQEKALKEAKEAKDAMEREKEVMREERNEALKVGKETSERAFQRRIEEESRLEDKEQEMKKEKEELFAEFAKLLQSFQDEKRMKEQAEAQAEAARKAMEESIADSKKREEELKGTGESLQSATPEKLKLLLADAAQAVTNLSSLLSTTHAKELEEKSKKCEDLEGDLRQANDRLAANENAKNCTICLDTKVDTVLIPDRSGTTPDGDIGGLQPPELLCGHMFCLSCAETACRVQCPLCRLNGPFTRVHPVYTP